MTAINISFIAFIAILAPFEIFFLFIMVSSIASYIVTRVPFAPSKTSDIAFIVQKLDIGPQHHFTDLGSGNGKVALLVEQLAGAQVTGYELSLWTHWWAKLRAHNSGSKAQLLRKNFFSQNWSGEQILYGYLFPTIMQRVEQKFGAECKTGAVLVLRDFPLPNRKPDEIWKPYRSTIYIYRA